MRTESQLLVEHLTSHPGKGPLRRFRACAQREGSRAERSRSFGYEGLAGRQPRTIARWGATSLSYRAAGFDYRVDHGAFFQVNRWLVDALVDRVTSGPQAASSRGTCSPASACLRASSQQSFERVIAVESAPAATAALEENLRGSQALR